MPEGSSSPLVPTAVASLSARDAPSFGFLPCEREAAPEVLVMNRKRRDFSKLPLVLQSISAGAIFPFVRISRGPGGAQTAILLVLPGWPAARSAEHRRATGTYRSGRREHRWRMARQRERPGLSAVQMGRGGEHGGRLCNPRADRLLQRRPKVVLSFTHACCIGRRGHLASACLPGTSLSK
jgi:hypothetical protein